MAAFEVIAHTELSSGDTHVTFSSIPDTYQHLYLVGSARSTRSSYADGSRVFFNGRDTMNPPDYSNTAIIAWGPSSPGAWDSVGDPSSDIAYSMDSPGASTESNMFSTSHLWILDYAATDKYTGTIGGSSSPGFSGDTNDYLMTMCHGHLRHTEAIHTIRVQNGVGNYAVGTAFTVYGINSA